MSPSEADLRAALHADEPDNHAGVDADRIIWTARSVRARRRNVALSAAAAVVVVAGVASGVAALSGTSSTSSGGSGMTSEAASGAGNAAAPSAPGNTANGPNSAAGIAVKCRPTPEHIALPGGGSPGQFGASGPLLAKPVSSFAVCVYSMTMGTGSNPVHRAGPPESVAVTGTAARQLADSLRNAAMTPQSVTCPLIRTARQVTIVMTPIAVDGSRLAPITASTSVPACNTQVTNGTAIRYNWQIPSKLQSVLGVTVVGGRDVQNPVDIVPGSVRTSVHHVSGSPVK